MQDQNAKIAALEEQVKTLKASKSLAESSALARISPVPTNNAKCSNPNTDQSKVKGGLNCGLIGPYRAWSHHAPPPPPPPPPPTHCVCVGSSDNLSNGCYAFCDEVGRWVALTFDNINAAVIRKTFATHTVNKKALPGKKASSTMSAPTDWCKGEL